MYELRFETALNANKKELWQWMTSPEGITKEMMPFMRMTFPKKVKSLNQDSVQLGQILCRSYLLFLGFIPIDYSDLTIVAMEAQTSFTEHSPMGTMLFWQHTRTLIQANEGHVILQDDLKFQPRFLGPVLRWITEKFFQHRHEVLKEYFS